MTKIKTLITVLFFFLIFFILYAGLNIESVSHDITKIAKLTVRIESFVLAFANASVFYCTATVSYSLLKVCFNQDNPKTAEGLMRWNWRVRGALTAIIMASVAGVLCGIGVTQKYIHGHFASGLIAFGIEGVLIALGFVWFIFYIVDSLHQDVRKLKGDMLYLMVGILTASLILTAPPAIIFAVIGLKKLLISTLC